MIDNSQDGKMDEIKDKYFYVDEFNMNQFLTDKKACKKNAIDIHYYDMLKQSLTDLIEFTTEEMSEATKYFEDDL
eukprot:14164812-Heterocapsa_arctica.AAC.1